VVHWMVFANYIPLFFKNQHVQAHVQCDLERIVSYFLAFINRFTENHLLYFDWHSPAFWMPLEMLLFFQRWSFGSVTLY